MTASTLATEANLAKELAGCSRSAAELASTEAAGIDPIAIGRLRIEHELAERRVDAARSEHLAAQQAERQIAATALLDTVVPALAAEDAAVWQAVAALRPAVELVISADRQRNQVVTSLKSDLMSVADAATGDRLRNPSFGTMSVDGRTIASTTSEVGITAMGIVSDVVALAAPVLSQQLRTAASVQAGLRQPTLATTRSTA